MANLEEVFRSPEFDAVRWINASLAPSIDPKEEADSNGPSVDELGSSLVLQLQLRHMGE